MAFCVSVYWWNVSWTILWSKNLGVENCNPAHQQTSNVSLSSCHFWAFFIVYYQLIFHDSRVKLGRIGPRDSHSQLDGLCWASGNGRPNIRPKVLGDTSAQAISDHEGRNQGKKERRTLS